MSRSRPDNHPFVDPVTTPVHTDGKHLRLGSERFVVKGVTYGSFLPRADGARYPHPRRLGRDLEAMAGLGLNTVRTYDVPPPELFTMAGEIGLKVLAGVDYRDWRDAPWTDRASRRRIERAGRTAIEGLFDRLDDRSTLLGVSVGNEVPADLVRFHGRTAVEDTLSDLVGRVHAIDPSVLATYTNYPTTEYLRVDDQDLITFNVFLEDIGAFDRYVRHLQVVSGAKPLLLTELGLASEIHGTGGQEQVLTEQLEALDRTGVAGATVFAWTDEWGVDQQPVTGWGFGITDEHRRPKPAARAVERWARSGLKELAPSWPRITAVVCAYNEEATIEQCLASLERCDYPDLEVLVCNDGSSDRTLELAGRFPFTVLDLPHGGLSRARNAGIEAATGDLVAFLDADAACHPQWPWHLALGFHDSPVAAVGGPNLPVVDGGLVERAVARSPGAPTEVLSADDRAEHIAGCNMAFRRDVLVEVGSFDPTYTAAGDDVDVCWKLLDAGHEIGFSPAAQVRHHRRGTVRGYLRQQRGYGRAEKLLSGAHPARFNRLGQARWFGCIYGGVGLLPALLRPTVYHGHQGSAPFQPISVDRAGRALSLATAVLPLVIATGLVALLGAGATAAAGLGAWPWLLATTGATLTSTIGFGVAVGLSVDVDRTEPEPGKLRTLVGLLHVLQPVVRSWGRLSTRRPATPVEPRAWTGDRLRWLQDLETDLRAARLSVEHLDPASRWDLEVRGGLATRHLLAGAVSWGWTPRLRTVTRPRVWAVVPPLAVVAALAWSPMAGAVVAAVAVAELAVEARRLRRSRIVQLRSMAGQAEGPTDG